MEHGHAHLDESEEYARQHKVLKIALLINLVFLIIEVIGGILSNSLALLADAGHMLTDVTALTISIFALNLSLKPPTPKRTYGFKRAEIIAAFVNGLTLWVMVVFIAYESFDRFINPPQIKSFEMLVIAVLGFIANLVSGLVVLSHVHSNLNIKGAFLHLMSDALGSVGVIAGAVLIMVTEWTPIDPIISVMIGVLIIMSSIDLIRESMNILMEGTPSEIDLAKMKEEIEKIQGVEDIHDMHAWVLSRGKNAFSAHVLVKEGANEQLILKNLIDHITGNYPIHHVTLQLETTNLQPVICSECGAPR